MPDCSHARAHQDLGDRVLGSLALFTSESRRQMLDEVSRMVTGDKLQRLMNAADNVFLFDVDGRPFVLISVEA